MTAGLFGLMKLMGFFSKDINYSFLILMKEDLTETSNNCLTKFPVVFNSKFSFLKGIFIIVATEGSFQG